MFFIKIIRFLKGTIGFTLTGGFPERFLNLCARAGFPVFDTLNCGEQVLAYTTARCYKQMRPIAKKSGVRMRVSSRSGLPFFIRRYRKRTGLLIGVLLFVLFLSVMSRFIWNVKIEGNETLSEEYLRSNLAECGIQEGAYSVGIDTLMAERQMMSLTPELSFVAINIHASTATVSVKEREMPPEFIDIETPCNVVAARTGQIVRLEAYNGQSMLHTGDVVEEGQLIVSGYVEDEKSGKWHFVHARAKVLAEFVEDVRIDIPLHQEMRENLGNPVNKRSIEVLGMKIPLYFTGPPEGPYNLKTKTVQPILLGLQIPVAFIVQTFQPLTVQTLTLTEEEAQKQAQIELEQYAQDFARIGEVVSRTATGRLDGDTYILEASFTLRQDIARQTPLQVDGPLRSSL